MIFKISSILKIKLYNEGLMTSISSANNSKTFAFFSNVYFHLKTFADNVHEYFTHHKATLQKIDSLSKRLFQAEQDFSPEGSQDKALLELKNLLEENAHLQLQKRVYNPKIRTVYEKFSQDLSRLQGYATTQKIENWVNVDKTAEKITIARWVQANPGQCRFAAYYNLRDVPLKFNEIPEGGILLTDPYAYLRHMQLEGKTSFFKSIIIKIKSLVCRLMTGKQFTHVEYSLGNGKIFDLNKKKDGLMRGEGNIVDKGKKVFYGIVLVPKEDKMLQAYNEHFPQTPCASFRELMDKIKAEVEEATANRRVQLDVLDIAKTVFTKKRPANYDPMQQWKAGACHYSCSGTTSALLSFFGMDIGAQFKKMDLNVTPTDFYNSHFFDKLFVTA
jgi:hypothetical protein